MLTEKPRKGQTVVWRNEDGSIRVSGQVTRCDDNLCWCDFPSGPNPFIWRFNKGLNTLAEVVK